MAAKLYLGTCKIDITPKKPIPLAGFSFREGTFLGIKQKIYTRIFYFSQSDGRVFVLIVSDLIWWEFCTIELIRRRLLEKVGLMAGEIMLHCTHNHSGPQTGNEFTPSLGVADSEYIDWLIDKVVCGVQAAKKEMFSVRTEIIRSKCGIGINRRKKVNGEILMEPNPVGPVDNEVIVIKFTDENELLRSVLVHYSCHATTTAENMVSSEFPGAAAEQLEKNHFNLVAAYLQGCCADVRPALIKEDKFYRGSAEDVKRLGIQLSDIVEGALSSQAKLIQNPKLCAHVEHILLPLNKVPTFEEIKKASLKTGITGEWGRILCSKLSSITAEVPFEVMMVKFADDLILMGFSGEIAVEYGLKIKQMNDKVIPLGYTNGMTGYIPTAQQINEGGYEAKDAALYFARPAPFHSDVEKIIFNAVNNLLERKG